MRFRERLWPTRDVGLGSKHPGSSGMSRRAADAPAHRRAGAWAGAEAWAGQTGDAAPAAPTSHWPPRPPDGEGRFDCRTQWSNWPWTIGFPRLKNTYNYANALTYTIKIFLFSVKHLLSSHFFGLIFMMICIFCFYV